MSPQLTKTRVRKGEWNEALCFSVSEHAKIEIAAQKCRDHWNIFYISPSTSLTLRRGIKSQQSAEYIAKSIAAKVLLQQNPHATAESFVR